LKIENRIDFGVIDTNKTNAVFLVIYVEKIAIWKYFKDQNTDITSPAIIMIDRWDGRMGFPGGTLEPNETLKDALAREIKEEIGISVKTEKLQSVVSFSQKVNSHLFALKVNEIEFFHIYYHILNNFSRSTLLHAYEEGDDSHFLAEITGIKIVPILKHNNKGINRFFLNNFAGSAKMDLYIFITEILGLDDDILDCK